MKISKLFLFSLLWSCLVTLSVKAQYVTQPLSILEGGPNYFIAVADSNVVWAKGQYNLHKTVNGGQTWQSIPFGSNYYTPRMLYAKDANNLYYKVQYTGPISGGPFPSPDCYLITNGVSSRVSFNTGGAVLTVFDYIYFFDLNNGVLLSGGNLYTTANNGSLWVQVTSGSFTGDPSPVTSFGEFTVSGNNIWVVVSGGRVAKSTNMGLNWIVSGPVGVSFESIAFKDSNNGIARVGTQLKATSDGGLSWNTVSYLGNLRAGKLVNIPGTSNYFCVGSRGQFYSALDGIDFSNDNGNSWIKIGAGTIHSDIGFASPNVYWTGGFDEMHKFSGRILGKTEKRFACEAIEIFPNPGNGFFTIKNRSKEKFAVKVLDAIGNKVLEKEENFSGTTLNLTNRPKGIYLVHISNEKQQIVKKIILQ
jgi:photosystem II stability/assembly factor-like uncharacterized protein